MHLSFIAVILCSLYLGNVHALQCYQTQPDNTVKENTCVAPMNACMKSEATGGGSTAVVKMCTVWNGDMNCTTVSTPPVSTAICHCNTDLCNSAGRTGVYGLLGFGVVAAVLYRLI